MLGLNFTVAGGLINLFIFYSDILAAGRNVFFLSISPSFPTVFEAILTLNVPFDVCYYEGFDAYVKTWLSIALNFLSIYFLLLLCLLSSAMFRRNLLD